MGGQVGMVSCESLLGLFTVGRYLLVDLMAKVSTWYRAGRWYRGSVWSIALQVVHHLQLASHSPTVVSASWILSVTNFSGHFAVCPSLENCFILSGLLFIAEKLLKILNRCTSVCYLSC